MSAYNIQDSCVITSEANVDSCIHFTTLMVLKQQPQNHKLKDCVSSAGLRTICNYDNI